MISDMKHLLRIVVGILILLAFFLTGLWWQIYWSEIVGSVPSEHRTSLVIGSVSEDVEDDFKEYQPIADYLARKLQSFGYTKGEVKVASSAVEMAQWMRRGEVDLYIDSVFPIFAVDRFSGSQPLVNRWKKGVEKYHTVIFTRRDSGINTIADLQGKIIIFDHPDSTSGYFLPKSMLIESGFNLREVGGPGEEVGLDEIGYYFAYGDKKLVGAVVQGLAVAGAQNQAEVEEIVGDLGGSTKDYRYLLTSPDVYRHIITANKKLDESIRAEAVQALKELEQTEEGKELLKEFKKTTRFTTFEPDYRQAYGGIENLLELVEKEIIAR